MWESGLTLGLHRNDLSPCYSASLPAKSASGLGQTHATHRTRAYISPVGPNRCDDMRQPIIFQLGYSSNEAGRPTYEDDGQSDKDWGKRLLSTACMHYRTAKRLKDMNCFCHRSHGVFAKSRSYLLFEFQHVYQPSGSHHLRDESVQREFHTGDTT